MRTCPLCSSIRKGLIMQKCECSILQNKTPTCAMRIDADWKGVIMAKGKKVNVYFCQSCGYESSKWMGQCPGCREWNTFVEELVEKKAVGK